MATYCTKQQQAVLRCIAQQGSDSVTALELAEKLREAGMPVGMATVYRQLEKLERQGLIHKIATDEGAFYRYCGQTAREGCFLLKCQRCGRIVHCDCSRLSQLYRHLEQEHLFAIDPRRTVFYGLCQSCRAAEHTKEEGTVSHGA